METDKQIRGAQRDYKNTENQKNRNLQRIPIKRVDLIGGKIKSRVKHIVKIDTYKEETNYSEIRNTDNTAVCLLRIQ